VYCPPCTEDLDLASVTTHQELAALLQTVRLRADLPSLRLPEMRTRHHETPLSNAVVSEMLNGGPSSAQGRYDDIPAGMRNSR
jgi:hypothetical protein